jgi:hypothetical protein
MSISPYYLLLGVGVGLVAILFLHNLRLALNIALTLGLVVGTVLLVLLIGSALGLWRLPRPLTGLFLGIRRLWQPFQRSISEWIRSLLR